MKTEKTSAEQFVSGNVGIDVEEVKEDIDLYNQSLDDLLDCKVSNDSKLRQPRNRLPLLAMVAHSYKEDLDLDDWIAQYSKSKKDIDIEFKTEKENYIHMRESFKKYNRCLEKAV